MKKVKAQKKVEKKTIKELMKARRPLLLNMELIAAVNKMFWENAHLSIFEICEMLREAGFAANATFYLDGREFQELVGTLHRNAEAVRAEVFNYPESIRGKRGAGVRIRECERGKQSELIYFSVMQEQEFFDGNCSTLLMIFRKPRTNWCAPVIISCGSAN